MDIVIRPAAVGDAEDVYQFVSKLEDTVFDYTLFNKYYLQNISNKDYHYYVAFINDKPVGFISCHGQILLHHLGMVYEIQELYVDEEYRSHQIGEQLIRHLEQLLDQQPYDILEVACNMKREKAHAFYKRVGFDQSHYKFTKKGNRLT